jgi:hypothetical protein
VSVGSQRVVQDAITGLTVAFSDLPDVGDMVDIGGQVGFRIWPGQGAILAGAVQPAVIALMKAFADRYADWMVIVQPRAGLPAEGCTARLPGSAALSASPGLPGD